MNGPSSVRLSSTPTHKVLLSLIALLPHLVSPKNMWLANTVLYVDSNLTILGWADHAMLIRQQSNSNKIFPHKFKLINRMYTHLRDSANMQNAFSTRLP